MRHMSFALTMALLGACGGGEDKGTGTIARCYLSSTVTPSVQSCIEFAPLDTAALQEAKAACDAPEAGVVKSWGEGAACSSIGRIGRCDVAQATIRSVTYVYETGSKDTDDFSREQSRESCVVGQHGEPPGVWTDIFDS